MKVNGKKEKACLKAGSKLSTLTDQQRRGKESLLRREKAGELIMVGSDKSGKNIPMSVELYQSCMEPHIKDDSVHSREDVAQAEKIMNGASTQILRVFKCGEDWGHEARLRSACGARNNEIPSLNQLVKDHKETLKTRPVCRARQAPNGNLGELVCNLLDPFVQEADAEERTEIKSTEELCSDLKATNERISVAGLRRGRFQQAGQLVVGSKDVEAFYPSMDVDLAAEEVKLEVEESNVDIEMDTEEAALYLACTMTPEEIEEEGLTNVVHKRRFKNGPRPGLTSRAVVGGASQRLEDQAWIPPARKPGRRQKRKMAGCVLRSACKLVMQNHFYSYDNTIRRQTKGGAIGNKLTEKLGRLLMKRHDKKYLKLLKKLDIREEIFDRYVDDELEGLAAVEPGVRFEEGKLIVKEDKIEEDRLLEADERTFRLLRDIGNSIFKCIQFTIDVPSLNENGRLPVLDLNVEVVDGEIKHGFFQKPCTSEIVIPFNSAHSRKMKMSVLVEEGVRRLRNHSRGMEWERSRQVMEDWSRRLRRSGYPATMRHEVIKSAVERYDKLCKEEDEGVRPIHRPRKWKEDERRREKELKRTNWHQNQPNQVSAPLILDPTAGDMTRDMKEVCKNFENVTGWRIPVVERAGLAMRSLAKAEPLKTEGCKRDDCFPCTTGGGNCERNGSGYRISCGSCLRAGKKAEYEGETGANGFTRGNEQLSGLRSKDPENALWKHCMLEHESEQVDFSMKVLGSFQSAMARQVNEGVRIQRSRADYLLNSKSEFHQHPVVRVVPMRGIQVEQGEDQGEGRGRGRHRGQGI